MKIAREYGQPPHEVAEWPPEWLAAAQMELGAQNGAAAERVAAERRRAKLRGMKGA